MVNENRTYISIDLKSYYASVECVERGLDPLTTNLVVADTSRTQKTICLAVSPSLKEYGISGRARLFEVEQNVKLINAKRQIKAPGNKFSGESFSKIELEKRPDLKLSYIAAPPRMGHYMDFSRRIYKTYLKYVSPEDIHVYSIDEVFMDVTNYLKMYKMSARNLAIKIIRDVLAETGITATAGIGPNLYLCKIAMDIMAKKAKPDKDGVRIAELDERSYRELLWNHTPLTDFWRIGKGYAKKLESHGMYTMGDIARCSLGKAGEFHNEDLLYKMFGVNAELLIDHAWGYEPCTIADIKAYKPSTKSVNEGQVLSKPYDYEHAKTIIKEMAEGLALQLLSKKLMTDQIVLTIGYDIDNLENEEILKYYHGEITTDFYGRKVPKAAHGTTNIEKYTSSTNVIVKKTIELFDKIIDKNLLVRRFYVSANRLLSAEEGKHISASEQLDFFTDYQKKEDEEANAINELQKEQSVEEMMIEIKRKFGKNSVLKGTNLKEGATGKDRNSRIGGHKA